jgi:dolichol-phosphate mannosyltransferase
MMNNLDSWSIIRSQDQAAQDLAIVVPTLCEAANIVRLIERVQRSLEPLGLKYEVVVVDDDSGDGIDGIVDKLSNRDPRIRCLVRKNIRGLAGAVSYGWCNTDAKVLGVIDADLQHPPELLPQLWHALQNGADVVVASRYASNNNRGRRGSLRYLVSQLAILMARPVQQEGLRVFDPMSGFFLLRRSCIEGIRFQTAGFKILLEVLARGKIHSVTEVPFTFGTRHAGRSKASVGVAIDYLKLLVKLWRTRF